MTRPAALSCPESVTISRTQWEGLRKLGAAAAGLAVDLMFMANEATGRLVSGTASQTISALGCGSGTFYALVDAGLVKVRPRRDVYLIQQAGSSVPKKALECSGSEQIATTTTAFVSLSGDREEEVQEKKGPTCVPKQTLERTDPVHATPPAPVEPTPEMRKLANEHLHLIAGATVDQVAVAIAQGTRSLRDEFRSMLRWIVQDGAGTTADQHAAGAIRTGDPLRYFVGVLKRKSADTRGLRLMAGRVQEEDSATAQEPSQRTERPSAPRSSSSKQARPVGQLRYSGAFLCYVDSRGTKFADKEGRTLFTGESLSQRGKSQEQNPEYAHIYHRFGA